MGSFKKEKSREKDKKKNSGFYTKDERIEETRAIISKLTEMKLTLAHPPIKQLFILMQDFIDNAIRHDVNIPFPAINKRIVGVLSISRNERIWVKMEHEDF